MSRIIVDGRRIQGLRTGVGHYAKSIIQNWPVKEEVDLLLSNKYPKTGLSVASETFFSPGVFWHLRAFWRVAVSGGFYFSPESLLVTILVGRKALLTVHDLTPLDIPETHKRWNVFIHRIAMRLAVARAGRIIVPTLAVKVDLLRHFPTAADRAFVVYEGVRKLETIDPDPEGFAPPIGPYALYVGTIEPRKNVLVLARVFLESAPADWQLILAGKVGWLDEDEQGAFEELCKNPRINHLGFVPDSWIPRLLSGAEVFCYVSDSEGFGLPVAEAMAAGVPVIHSDDPALVEVAGGAGLVVRRRHLEDDLKVQLETVATMDADTRASRVTDGLEASRRFDWPAAAGTTRGHLIAMIRAQS